MHGFERRFSICTFKPFCSHWISQYHFIWWSELRNEISGPIQSNSLYKKKNLLVSVSLFEIFLVLIILTLASFGKEAACVRFIWSSPTVSHHCHSFVTSDGITDLIEAEESLLDWRIIYHLPSQRASLRNVKQLAQAVHICLTGCVWMQQLVGGWALSGKFMCAPVHAHTPASGT